MLGTCKQGHLLHRGQSQSCVPPESVANSHLFMCSHVFTWIRCKFSYFLCFHLNPLQILIFFMFSYVFTWIRCQFFDVFCIFSNFLTLFKVMVTISSALPNEPWYWWRRWIFVAFSIWCSLFFIHSMHCNGSPHVPWYAPQRPQRQTPLMKEMAMLIKRQWRWCKTKKYLCPSCVGWFPTEGPHIGKSNNTTKVPSIGNLDLLANIVSSSYLFRLYPTSWSTDGPNKSLRNWLPLKIETRQRPEIWFDANTG